MVTMDMDMARGLLMLRPAMDMVMDMAMEVMATEAMEAMAIMVMDMARGLLMLKPAMDIAMEATAMDMAMDTAMDMDTMDKRNKPEKVSYCEQYQEFSEHLMKFIYIKSSHDLSCCYTLN